MNPSCISMSPAMCVFAAILSVDLRHTGFRVSLFRPCTSGENSPTVRNLNIENESFLEIYKYENQ